MKLLKIIKTQDICSGQGKKETSSNYLQREVVRAVVFDEERNVGLIHVGTLNFHQLPGGGIETGESKEEALRREIIEELGCKIEILSEIGQIDEYRDYKSTLQQNYCYICRVIGKKGKPSPTEGELKYGCDLLWLPINEAVKQLQNDQPIKIAGQFSNKRDLLLLQEALL